MDSKTQKTEKSEQFSWSLLEEKASNPKSFTCSFCKKEFSNAQALGGHMNIHRRDRAKLRNSSPDDQISSPSSDVSSSLPQVFEEKSLVILESSQVKSRHCNFPLDDEAGSSKGKDSSIEKKKVQSVEGSLETELDLELRLGPQPPKGFF